MPTLHGRPRHYGREELYMVLDCRDLMVFLKRYDINLKRKEKKSLSVLNSCVRSGFGVVSNECCKSENISTLVTQTAWTRCPPTSLRCT